MSTPMYGPHEPAAEDVAAAQHAAIDAIGPDTDRFFSTWTEMEQTERAQEAAAGRQAEREAEAE